MPEYADAGHRPHAVHKGEEPQNPIAIGPESISVTLDTWGPKENLFPTLYDALQSNWGDEPSRTVSRMCPKNYDARFCMDHDYGRCKLSDSEFAYVESCFAGKTLPQILELITFEFTIDGVSRAFTHQNVRTRVGAAFMQHGGRDNDWRHRAWTMPETIDRLCQADDRLSSTGSGQSGTNDVGDGRLHCISDWEPIESLMSNWADLPGMGKGRVRDGIELYLSMGRQLYAALVDAGIPWQDARRVLWMGTQTYIHDIYNYLALKGYMARRLEFIMDWEHVCVAQLMLREVNMKCPPIFGKYLQSASDAANRAMFAGLESWPPDGKYPNPHERCKICTHAKGNHYVDVDGAFGGVPGSVVCEVCYREKGALVHEYEPEDTLPRTHRPEQNPFWVLHPDSLKGGPVVWVPTNGAYPSELRKEV